MPIQIMVFLCVEGGKVGQNISYPKVGILVFGGLTSAPLGAWKCDSPPFLGYNTNNQTNQQADRPTERRTWRFIGKFHFQ